MKRRFAYSAAILVAFAAASCGGGEPSGEEGGEPMGGAEMEEAPSAGAGALTMPAWFQHDAGAGSATLRLVAGSTDDNNYWNYNGYYGGAGEIFIPVGTEVTITLANEDQNMAHSVGVDERRSGFPANFSDPVPVFEGGITSNPASLTEATLPGESETITFTADEAGQYSLVCYVPGHAAVGMYLYFTVTEDGRVGFTE